MKFKQSLISQYKQKILAKLYIILLEHFCSRDNPKKNWLVDMNKVISDKDRAHISMLTQKLSSNISLREQPYKLDHQCYFRAR